MAVSVGNWDEARVVAEDLAYLQDEWSPRLDPPSLRRLSPTLRKLLGYGTCGRAWRSLGLPGEPYVTATVLDAALGTVDRTIIKLAFAPPGETTRTLFDRGGGQAHFNQVTFEEGSLGI